MTNQKSARRTEGTGDSAANRDAGKREEGAVDGRTVGQCDHPELSLASFFAARRADAAARGFQGLADGYGVDLALIETRGLLRQAEGRAAS